MILTHAQIHFKNLPYFIILREIGQLLYRLTFMRQFFRCQPLRQLLIEKRQHIRTCFTLDPHSLLLLLLRCIWLIISTLLHPTQIVNQLCHISNLIQHLIHILFLFGHNRVISHTNPQMIIYF